ncbi:MAG: hypothetical protein ACREFW_09395 [Rhizomicrobium sp.]
MSQIHHLSAAAMLMASAAAWTWPAFAAQIPQDQIPQDRPTTVDGVQTVCTGVGESKDNPRWSAYPLKLVFVNSKGQYTAGEQVDISKDGHMLMQTRCDAPWLLIKPGAGNYRVTATLQGAKGVRRTGADFSAKGQGPQKTVTFDFPAAQTG